MRKFWRRSLLNPGCDHFPGSRRLNQGMDGLFKFIAGCGLHLRYCRWHAVIAALLAFALGSADSGFAQPARPKENTPATFQPEARKHVSPKRPEEPIDMNPLQTPAGEVTRAILPGVTMAPTRSSFLASWRSVGDATGYRIDVSTDPSFKSYVSGYEHCDVGNVTSRIVSRLNPGTKYYYRVQPYNSAGAGPNSEMAAATTTTASGLVINPTFDSSDHGQPSVGCDPDRRSTRRSRSTSRCLAIQLQLKYSSGIRIPSPTARPLMGRSPKAFMLSMASHGGHTFSTSRQTQRQRMTQPPTPACRRRP